MAEPDSSAQRHGETARLARGGGVSHHRTCVARHRAIWRAGGSCLPMRVTTGRRRGRIRKIHSTRYLCSMTIKASWPCGLSVSINRATMGARRCRARSHMISNIRIECDRSCGRNSLDVSARFHMLEYRPEMEQRSFGGLYEYSLVRDDLSFRIAAKFGDP